MTTHLTMPGLTTFTTEFNSHGCQLEYTVLFNVVATYVGLGREHFSTMPIDKYVTFLLIYELLKSSWYHLLQHTYSLVYEEIDKSVKMKDLSSWKHVEVIWFYAAFRPVSGT